MVNITIKKTLKDLGQRLKEARLLKDDSQKEFAARIGVSIPTLHKMGQFSVVKNSPLMKSSDHLTVVLLTHHCPQT